MIEIGSCCVRLPAFTVSTEIQRDITSLGYCVCAQHVPGMIEIGERSRETDTVGTQNNNNNNNIQRTRKIGEQPKSMAEATRRGTTK